MYEYSPDREVTYSIRVFNQEGGTEDDVQMTVGTYTIGEHLDAAANAFFAALAEHYEIEVTQSVRATGNLPTPVFPAG